MTKQFQSTNAENSKLWSLGIVWMLVLVAWCLPILASAHEVYILPPEVISEALSTTSPNPVLAYSGNEGLFYFWGFIAVVVTLTVFFASTFRRVEGWTGPLFALLKRYAHPVVRLTAGTTLIVFGITGSLYGQELPLRDLFAFSPAVVQFGMIALGISIIVGLQTRIMALLALLIYAYAASVGGFYLLTYVQHAAAYVFLILVGGGPWTIDHRFHLGWKFRKRLERFAPYAYPVLRVGLGASIMFAAFYAKFLHSNLALNVITYYRLDAFFPFDPLFIVLGAFIIEFLAGLMLVLGIEIRWTTLFLVFWLTLAHLYFPEAPWVHLSLYGFGIAIFFHGYDRYAIEGRLFKRRGAEPVL